jgi:hypothetical protein
MGGSCPFETGSGVVAGGRKASTRFLPEKFPMSFYSLVITRVVFVFPESPGVDIS